MKRTGSDSGMAAGSGRPKRFDPRATTAKEAIEQVVLANVVLANEGVFDYLGHVSARNPENEYTYFISRSCAPEMVREGDILDLGAAQNIIDKSGAWFSYKSDRLGQGRENVKNYLKEHPEIMAEIELAILQKAGLSKPSPEAAD